MLTMLTELFARFSYVLLCYGCFGACYYLTLGWQCEWFAAVFANQCQTADYCFLESLVWEGGSKDHKTSITQCWGAIHYSSSVYFYGVSLQYAHTLSKLGLLSHLIFVTSFQVSGFLSPGLVRSSWPGLGFLIWWSCFMFSLSSSLFFCSLVEELSLERLDSELQQAMNA